MITTHSRISRITDYGCKQTGPLFGDLATATIVSPIGSERNPVHFEVVFAAAGMEAAESVLFNYDLRENVLLPTPEGGKGCAARRLVFSLDGLGIADAALVPWPAPLPSPSRGIRIRPENVQFLVPHQAGTGIVRFTGK